MPGFEGTSATDVYAELAEAERLLHVLEKLSGFAIAADTITEERGHGAYHLIIPDSHNRTVSIRPYPIARLEQANLGDSDIEKRTNAGEPIEAALVSAGPIDALRKVYPNYVLDTQAFVAQIARVTTPGRREPIQEDNTVPGQFLWALRDCSSFTLPHRRPPHHRSNDGYVTTFAVGGNKGCREYYLIVCPEKMPCAYRAVAYNIS